jgi:hypothetical protein
VQADFPAESTRIVSADGLPVYTKQLGGVTGFQSIVIPSLSKGMYWMTFYGNGWQTTSRFVIAK